MSSPARARPAPQVLEAGLERLTYVNGETGDTVARVTVGCESDLVTVGGALLGARHRGPASAGALNTLPQQLIPGHDGTPEPHGGGRVFRVGVEVSQVRNNYDKATAGFFNGTAGAVTVLGSVAQTPDRTYRRGG